MSINTTDIVNLFGAQYIDNGQNASDLMSKIFQPSETDKILTPITTKETQLRKGKVAIGGVLQAFQKQFTPMGNTTFTGRKIDLEPMKIDVLEYPDDLVRTYAGFLTSLDEADRAKWTFVSWWLETQVGPQAIQDWELGVVFGGVKGVVTPGVALAASSALNGIRKLINIEIAAGYANAIDLGVVPTDPIAFVEYMEAFAASIPKLYQQFMGPIAMSQTLESRFKKGMRDRYNQNYNQTDLVTIIDTNLSIKGLVSHEGSDKVWTTVKGNGIVATRKPKLQSVFEVQSVDRQVKAFTDFDKGIGFWDPTLLYTNLNDLS